MYSHLSVRQLEDVHYRSSLARHARLDCRAEQIKTEEEVKYWLGDQEGELPVFRTEKNEKDVLVTLATGKYFGFVRDVSFFHFPPLSIGN